MFIEMVQKELAKEGAITDVTLYKGPYVIDNDTQEALPVVLVSWLAPNINEGIYTSRVLPFYFKDDEYGLKMQSEMYEELKSLTDMYPKGNLHGTTLVR